MSENPSLRIGIIDPHPVTSHGIKHLLDENHFLITWEAESSISALDLLNSSDVDIMIFEPVFEMSRAGAFVENLQQTRSELRVIIHTMAVEDPWLRKFMDLGVKALVSKRKKPHDLMMALSHTMSGRAFVSQDILDCMCGGGTTEKTNISRLTKRELEVFRMVGLGQRASVIAKAMGISTRTVDAHKQHIKDKLELGGNVSLAVAAGCWLQRDWTETA